MDRSLTQLRKDASVMNYSVAKALAILEYLAAEAAPRDLGVISHALEIHKSTVYRFLTTLESFGYISQDEETGRYALGSRVVWLGSKFLESLDVRALARPYLEDLVEATRETVHLAILDDFEVVYIDKVDGHQPVKMASRVGNRMPAHSTGLGKALLAHIDESQWPVFVARKGLASFTTNTIHDPESLYSHLAQIKERGYSIDDCENEDGIRCVAVPVRDHTGKVVAAISISGWSLTMTPDRDEGLAILAKNASQSITERLGGLRILRDKHA